MKKMLESCEEHKNEAPINYENDGPPGCVGCGRLYWTIICKECGEAFINWGASGFDDVCAAPYITSSGDVYCDFCGPQYEKEDGPWEDEWMDDEDILEEDWDWGI